MLSVNAPTISQESKIVAKINESLLYNRSYGKMEVDLYFGIAWYIYQNGYLNQSLLSSNGAFYGTNNFHLFINIETYQEDEAGEYFVTGYIAVFTFYFFCPSKYFSFLVSHLSIVNTIWHVETLQIQTSGE